MAARLDRRPIVFVRIAAFALATVLVLGGCRHDAPEPYRLPTGARLDPVGTSIPHSTCARTDSVTARVTRAA